MKTIREHDAITGDFIDREATESELAQWAKDEADAQAQEKAKKERAKLKTATLAKLGLTADEVAALLS